MLDREMVDKERVGRQAAELFRRVRDVPYMLGAAVDPGEILADPVAVCGADCGSKLKALAVGLKQLGYGVSFAVAEFSWADIISSVDQRVVTGDLNEALNGLEARGGLIDRHPFLLVSYPNSTEEVVVDPTWDSLLEIYGFPVNDWVGMGSTELAVKHRRLTRLNPVVVRVKSKVLQIKGAVLPQKGVAAPFNDAFNDWLKNLRLQRGGRMGGLIWS